MAQIFRKSAMDKISSPEQLDKAVVIISPSFWMAALGAGIIICAALIWSIFGRLPINVSASGMFMDDDGIYTVISETQGTVEEILVEEGSSINAGDIIARVGSEDYEVKLDELETRRENVEAVTFYSYDDPATADTKALLDIKAQSEVAGTALSADQITLRERYEALSKQRSAASSAKSASSSAESALKKAQSSYVAAQKTYKDAQGAYSAAEAEYKSYIEQLKTAGIVDVTVDPTISPIVWPEGSEAQQERLAELEKSYKNAGNALEKAESAVHSKELEVGNAESKYSQALQAYNSAKAAKESLEDTVSQLEAKVKGDSAGKSSQVSALEEQFEAAKGSALDQIGQEIRKTEQAMNKATIRSGFDGTVSNLSVDIGNMIQPGSSVCKIKTSDYGSRGTILYIPVSEGKKIKEGMDVVVYPSTVNRQEYGHMEGTVSHVSDFVVSAEDMMNTLGDQALVQSFQQHGAVIRVTLDLKKDSATKSGYYWSSKKGADIILEEGTLVSADIVTAEKAPITMLIPLLKEKLDNFSQSDEEPGNTGNQ